MKRSEKLTSDQSDAMSKWLSVPLPILITLAGTYCMYVIHVTGKIFHETYLILFGLDPSLFPRSLDEIAVLGQAVFLEKLTEVFLKIADVFGVNSEWIFIFTCALVFVFSFLIRHFPKNSEKPKWLPELWPWIVDLGKSIVVVSMTALMFINFSVIWLMMAWLPFPVGEKVAVSRYEKDAHLFIQGCVAATKRQQCVQVFKPGKPLSEGFLIDSSSTHIALYDVKLNRVRAFERVGTELRVMLIKD